MSDPVCHAAEPCPTRDMCSDFEECCWPRCDHNCIPCRGGLRHLFRAGWVCVRCDQWFGRLEPTNA